MRQQGRRVGEHAAPVPRVVRTIARAVAQGEVHGTARAEEERRPCGRDARAVAGDQEIGAQQVALLFADGVFADGVRDLTESSDSRRLFPYFQQHPNLESIA